MRVAWFLRHRRAGRGERLCDHGLQGAFACARCGHGHGRPRPGRVGVPAFLHAVLRRRSRAPSASRLRRHGRWSPVPQEAQGLIRYDTGFRPWRLCRPPCPFCPPGGFPQGGDGRGRIADSMMVCPVQQSVPASGMNPMRCSPPRLSSASLRSMGVSWSPVPNAPGHPGPASMACPVSGSGSRTVAGCAC